jgi:hypothetical protein
VVENGRYKPITQNGDGGYILAGVTAFPTGMYQASLLIIVAGS